MRSKHSFKNKVFSIKNIKKKLTLFFFRTESRLMDKVEKNKKVLELVTSCSSGCETRLQSIFICYILSDQVWWCNKEQFLTYSKNFTCKFMQAKSWHHFFSFSFPLLILQNVERKGNITIWISWEWKKLFRWNKKYFPQFLMGCHLVKK